MLKTPVKKTTKKVIKKTITKKPVISKSKKIKKEIKDDIKFLKKKIISLTHEAKKKYDSTDDKTKQQIVAGIASAAAIIAGIIGSQKLKGKK